MSKFPVLNYNEAIGSTNFPEWKERVIEHMKARFTQVANLFWQNELAEPVMPDFPEHETRANVAKYEVEMRTYGRKRDNFQDQKALCLGELLTLLPETYKSKLYAHEKWSHWIRTDDVAEVQKDVDIMMYPIAHLKFKPKVCSLY